MFPVWVDRYSPPAVPFSVLHTMSTVKFVRICPNVRRIYVTNETDENIVIVFKYWYFGTRFVSAVIQPGFNAIHICSSQIIRILLTLDLAIGSLERQFTFFKLKHECDLWTDNESPKPQYLLASHSNTPPSLFSLAKHSILSCLHARPSVAELTPTLRSVLPTAVINLLAGPIYILNPLLETEVGPLRLCFHHCSGEERHAL
jgi:hypothetical protein